MANSGSDIRREASQSFACSPSSCGLRGDIGFCRANQAAGPIGVICERRFLEKCWQAEDSTLTVPYWARSGKHAVCLSLEHFFKPASSRGGPT